MGRNYYYASAVSVKRGVSKDGIDFAVVELQNKIPNNPRRTVFVGNIPKQGYQAGKFSRLESIEYLQVSDNLEVPAEDTPELKRLGYTDFCEQARTRLPFARPEQISEA